MRECGAWGGGACALGAPGRGGRAPLASLSQGLAGWPEGVKALKVCEALSLFAQQSGLAGDLKVLNGDTL